MLSASGPPPSPTPRLAAQGLVALIAAVALEAMFAAMARLGDLTAHVPEFVALALGAGDEVHELVIQALAIEPRAVQTVS